MLTIPIDSALPYFDFQAELDGATYTIELRWNTREEFWYCGLLSEDGATWLIAPRRAAVDSSFATNRADRMPPGLLFFVDTSGNSEEAGRNDLGARVQLCYLTAADLGFVVP